MPPRRSRRSLPATLLLTAPLVGACAGADSDSVPDAVEKALSDPAIAALTERATADYAAYVAEQSERLVSRTTAFVEAYQAGDDREARAIYPVARMHWERIETVAESFADLDPLLDAREADLEPGTQFTGWHRIEKDLWPARAEGYVPLGAHERRYFAVDLLDNTVELDHRIQQLTFSLEEIADGSRGLLEEVALGKVTGEEEYWSRTDLWDFQANVDGARVAFVGVEPILARTEPELVEELSTRFADLQVLLDGHRTEDGFAYYDDLSEDEVKKLADAVNALGEPLSRLTAAVLA